PFAEFDEAPTLMSSPSSAAYPHFQDYCYDLHTRIRFVILIWSQFILGGGCMGYSKAQKAKTHERIVKLASKRFREAGLAGIGIAELMKEAGLTVGGFYKHFDSRDDLVAEAVNSAFGGWKRRVEAAKSNGPPVSYEKL